MAGVVFIEIAKVNSVDYFYLYFLLVFFIIDNISILFT